MVVRPRVSPRLQSAVYDAVAFETGSGHVCVFDPDEVVVEEEEELVGEAWVTVVVMRPLGNSVMATMPTRRAAIIAIATLVARPIPLRFMTLDFTSMWIPSAGGYTLLRFSEPVDSHTNP